MGRGKWASGYLSAVNIRRRGVVIHAEMARPLLWACAAALFLAAPAGAASEICTPSQPQQAQQQTRSAKPAGKADDRADHGNQPRVKWWIDPKRRAEWNITDQQSAAIELIWKKSAPTLADARGRVAKMEEALAQLTRDDSVEESKIIAQIEQLEQTRAEANKLRTLMIYRMNKLLTPDQRARVKAHYERPDPGKRDSSR